MYGLWRSICITVTLIGFYLSWVVVRTLIKNNTKRMQFRTRMLRTAGHTFANILGITVQHEGPQPPSPCFWICNHVSSLDAVMLLMTVENPIVVARHDVESWPVIGTISSGIDTIFVDRSRFDAMPIVADKMAQAIQKGYSVVMFPEATTGKGDVLLPFKPPLFEPAIRLGVPLGTSVCLLACRGQINAKNVLFSLRALTSPCHAAGRVAGHLCLPTRSPRPKQRNKCVLSRRALNSPCRAAGRAAGHVCRLDRRDL